MNAFFAILNQIAYLFAFIILGYVLTKCRALPKDSAAVLSKLENNLFIPALVLSTFIENFTVERISQARGLLGVSAVIAIVMAVAAVVISRIVTRDEYIRRIYTYGLAFSNFGFMGNAVMSCLYPDIFFEYLIFTLPLWILIYIWGVPSLLMKDSGKKQTLRQAARSFVNPMFIAMVVGMVIGLVSLPVPKWLMSVVEVSADCMSPMAMILTGCVVASVSLKKTLANFGVYIVSVIRLIVIPAVFIAICSLVNLPETVYICALFSLAMPLGLNTIVIPSAYGKDTTVAAGMAIVSHLMSIVTIPLVISYM